MSLATLLQPKPCPDCGYDPVFHRAERWSIYMDRFTSMVFAPVETINVRLSPIWGMLADTMLPRVVRIAAFVGLVQIVNVSDASASETTQFLWKEATRRGIEMIEVRPLGLPRRFFVASYRGRSIVFEGLPRPNRIQPSLAWIDNKEEVKRHFLRQGFPVARGAACSSWRQAESVARDVGFPLITKPHVGSNGRHTSAQINNPEDLWKGFISARRLSPKVIVEQELRGPVFRATLIGGKLVAVLRRDPPQVVGDGVQSIAALVARENQNPLREGPVFAKLSLEHIADPNRIPSMGEIVKTNFKVNWGVGGTSRDVTDEVHHMNVKLFENIGRYLRDDIIGIDFMIENISQPWTEQNRCGVIECNSLPLIGNHHVPFIGPVRNVAGAVWDLVFPLQPNENPAEAGPS